MQSNKSWLREPFSGISHFVGAILSLVGMISLLILGHGKPYYTFSFLIYGLSLIALYTVSTLYHSLQVRDEHADHWQRMDYVAIFLLIAGSYTPICLIPIRDHGGGALLAAVWAISALGIMAVLLWKRAPHWIRVVLYIGLGWMALMALPALRQALPASALWWLVAGGLTYTGGVAFYAHNKPRFGKLPIGSHDIWHLFVMGGSACHFVVMFWYMALPAAMHP